MDSVIKCTDYIIGKHTYLLESRKENNSFKTIVYDRRGIYEVPKQTLSIVKTSCKMHGTTYEASLQSSKSILGNTQSHKLPIVVGHDFDTPLILYPLFSPKASHNVWVMFNNVTEFHFQQEKPSITLGHRLYYPLPVQKSTITNQTTASFALYKHIEDKLKKKLT